MTQSLARSTVADSPKHKAMVSAFPGFLGPLISPMPVFRMVFISEISGSVRNGNCLLLRLNWIISFFKIRIYIILLCIIVGFKYRTEDRITDE